MPRPPRRRHHLQRSNLRALAGARTCFISSISGSRDRRSSSLSRYFIDVISLEYTATSIAETTQQWTPSFVAPICVWDTCCMFKLQWPSLPADVLDSQWTFRSSTSGTRGRFGKYNWALVHPDEPCCSRYPRSRTGLIRRLDCSSASADWHQHQVRKCRRRHHPRQSEGDPKALSTCKCSSSPHRGSRDPKYPCLPSSQSTFKT